MKKAHKIQQNKKGFTLLEAFLALLLFLLLQQLLMFIFQFQYQFYQQLAKSQDEEWQLFCLQLRSQTRNVTLLRMNPIQLIFLKDGKTITIEFYRNKDDKMIRRRVNDKGHEPMWIGIKKGEWEKVDEHHVQLYVETKDNKKRTLLLYF